jgi:hypothetical protein
MEIIVTMSKSEYNQLYRKVIDEILKDSKESYGVKFISRDTNNELDDNAIRGWLSLPVSNILHQI